jgi:hypothetical protein
VELLHPATMEKLGITIRVMGKDSDRFKEISNKQNRARMAKAQKSRKLEIDPDELDDAVVNLLAACTLSWDGMILEGESLDFTKDNAVMVYSRFPWIREQVDIAINDRANFMKG